MTLNRGKPEVLLQSPKELTAIDPATGTKRWSFETKGIASVPSAVAGKDTIFLPAGEFTALKPHPDGGTPDVVWTSLRLRPATASPVYYKEPHLFAHRRRHPGLRRRGRRQAALVGTAEGTVLRIAGHRGRQAVRRQ